MAMARQSAANAEMGLLDAIYGRRSVRSYGEGLVDAPTVEALLNAAVRAPTAISEQPWAFAVVQDAELLHRLSDQAKPMFVEEMRHRMNKGTTNSFEHVVRPEFNIFHGATTLIVICARPVGPFVAADCWLAAENLMLAAHAAGLGSCVIGSAASVLNVRKVKAEIGIPDDYTAIVPIVVGVPAGDAPPTPRKAPHILAWKK